MLVCSYNAKHELGVLEAGWKTCPVCAAPLREKPPDQWQTEDTVIETPAIPPPVIPGKGTLAGESKAGPAEEDTPAEPSSAPPPVVLVCEKVPRHDISSRRPDDMKCPQPGCNGPIVDLVCVDVRHDLSGRNPEQLICPFDGSPLMKLACTAVPTHSMFGREPGQLTCPVCGAPLERLPLQKWDGIRGPGLFARLRLWFNRNRWRVAVGTGIAVVLVLAVLTGILGIVYLGPNACSGGIDEVNRIIASKPPVEKLRAEGEARFDCHRIDLAMPLLRQAADSHDAISARRLGQFYDPTVTFTNQPQRPQSSAPYAWHWYETARDLGEPAVAADLTRLRDWLDSTTSDDPEVVELKERLQR